MTNTSKGMGAKLGHVKRRLKAEEALTGKHLELALNVVGNGSTGNELIDKIANKLQTRAFLI